MQYASLRASFCQNSFHIILLIERCEIYLGTPNFNFSFYTCVCLCVSVEIYVQWL